MIEVDIVDDINSYDLGMVLFGAEVIVIIYSTRIIINPKVNFPDNVEFIYLYKIY